MAAASFVAAPAFAACTQDRAIYADRDDAYTLTFITVPENLPVMTSNEFSLQMNGSDLKMDGVVMWSDSCAPPQRHHHVQVPDRGCHR